MRLAEVVHYAYTYSRYFRKLYARLPDRVDDLASLPVTNKKPFRMALAVSYLGSTGPGRSWFLSKQLARPHADFANAGFGNVNTNDVPQPGCCSPAMLPPCASITRLQMLRPSP